MYSRFVFFLRATATTEIYTLSLHDALPISLMPFGKVCLNGVTNRYDTGSPAATGSTSSVTVTRSEEHTSELQSLRHLVCRLLLEKKKSQDTELVRNDVAYIDQANSHAQPRQ